MATVLGIDVGLKNLSLCVLQKQDCAYSILLWDNYNLLDKDPVMCEGVTKKGTVCGKSASVMCGGIPFCKTHARVPGKKIAKCKKVESYTIQDIARIVLEKISCLYRDNTEIFEQIKRVVIENQPRINNKMKIVSTLILGKLTELLPPSVPVRFISACSKLRIGEKVGSTASKTGTKGAKGYDNRKKLSVEYTRAFLQNKNVANHEFWLEHFEGRKKLNDMADSIGFCISVLR